MDTQQSQSHLRTIHQTTQRQDENCCKQNYPINKDSVNTSIGHDKNHDTMLKHSTKNLHQSIHLKKTKFIWKPQINQAPPILKHKQVVQTLRNITKNIKHQLKTLCTSTTQIPQVKCLQSNKQSMEHENQKKFQTQKEYAESVRNNNNQRATKVTSNPAPVESMQIQINNLFDTKMNQKQVILEEIPHSKTTPQIQSPQKNLKSLKKPQHVLLYSKYKGVTQIFPVFQDCLLSDKKEFRNLTIHRQFDNDVDSDQQQIQMGVGFMYDQLMYSCHKYSQMKQKQSHSIKASNLKKGKNARDQVPLEKVKQKLVFK